jgi:hypothetical protein
VIGDGPLAFGFSLARAAIARLEEPIAADAHALPNAMSKRNMLAPSWRCAATTLPDGSTTTIVKGGTPVSAASSNPLKMILFASPSVTIGAS